MSADEDRRMGAENRGTSAEREREPLRVGVLASGTGTNLQALLDTVHGKEVVVVGVAADRPAAQALERARALGIDTGVFVLAEHEDRPARDAAIAGWMLERDVELIVLAGYMAILTSAFLSRFAGAVVNVHPSLLPAFPGIRAIDQALDYGVKVFGVTVHFVEDDGGVDTGPVILQRGIELPHAVDPDEVHAQLRPIEHALVPEAVRLIARGAVTRDPDNPRRTLIRE
ncbi:MAG TPA: phosphoribosylglycinamide formyltransferase [Solirubrobacteraceae bacterium]|jgi:phosphoribosylglycinamide formyltransferase-1|nr:phosphoribosylglycinamide formyltransferase [Solirubrobacteraceae bacterium]